MKKGDFIAALSVLVVAGVCFGGWKILHRDSGKTVTVRQDNETVYTGALAEDRSITLDTNTVEIRSGSVRMSYSDCKNQICVHHTAIAKAGESIICLPNKVIVTIE